MRVLVVEDEAALRDALCADLAVPGTRWMSRATVRKDSMRRWSFLSMWPLLIWVA